MIKSLNKLYLRPQSINYKIILVLLGMLQIFLAKILLENAFPIIIITVYRSYRSHLYINFWPQIWNKKN